MIGIAKHKRAIGAYIAAGLTLFQAYQMQSGHVWVGEAEIVLMQGLNSLLLVGGVIHAKIKNGKTT